MHILCDKPELIEAVSNVQRAVSVKSSLPELEGILLRAHGETLYLAGFDMELGITTTIPATVKEPGEIILSARMFGEIVRKMPGETVSIQTDARDNAMLCSEDAEFSILGKSASRYPDIPKVEDGSSCISLSQQLLKSMIRQTIFAVAAPNDPRPIYTGTKFVILPEELRLVSVDGYRLAMRCEPLKSDENMSFVVPGKNLQEILKLLKDEEKPCSLIVGRRHVIFEINGYAVISRLLDGEFIDYERIISPEVKTTVTVNARNLMDTVDRVALVISDRLKTHLICRFKDSTVSVSCTTALGSAKSSVPAAIDGKEEEIGCNSRYLLDALKNSETDEVIVTLNGPTKPIIIKPKEGNSFLFLVQPVLLKNSVSY